jgi:hypothetical protein
VAKHAKPRTSVVEKLRVVPWLALVRGAAIVGRRWTALSTKERARLVELVRESGGRVGNLSVKQRLELRRLAGRLELKEMLRDLAALRRGGRRRKRR